MNPEERIQRLNKLAEEKARHGKEVNRLFEAKKNKEAEALIVEKIEHFQREEDALRKPGEAGGRYKSVSEFEQLTAIVTFYDMLLEAYRRAGTNRMKTTAAEKVFEALGDFEFGPAECLRRINGWRDQLETAEQDYVGDEIAATKQRILISGQFRPQQGLSNQQIRSVSKKIVVCENTGRQIQSTSLPLTPQNILESVRGAYEQFGLRIPKYRRQ